MMVFLPDSKAINDNTTIIKAIFEQWSCRKPHNNSDVSLVIFNSHRKPCMVLSSVLESEAYKTSPTRSML